MPMKDMETSTAAFVLIRTLGGAIGISIGGTIFASELSRRLRQIPNYTPPSGDPVTGDVSSLHLITPVALREAILHAYTKSISTIWIVYTPLAFVGLIAVLFVRNYSLQRAHVQGGEKAAADEKAAEASQA